MTAISLGDKKAIPIFLETLNMDTLDTGENYGENVSQELAGYLGVDFGLDKSAWLEWWNKNGADYKFPNRRSTRRLPDEINK